MIRRAAAPTLALLLALGGCGPHGGEGAAKPSPAPSSPVPSRAPTAEPTLGPVTLRATSRGKRRVSIVVSARTRTLYTITADSNDSVRHGDGTYVSHFRNPEIVFNQQDGGHMRGTARTADVDGAKKDVTMVGDVHLKTSDGTTLACDRLVYEQASDHVHGTGNVVVRTRLGDTLRGATFDGDLAMKRLHVEGGGP